MCKYNTSTKRCMSCNISAPLFHQREGDPFSQKALVSNGTVDHVCCKGRSLRPGMEQYR